MTGSGILTVILCLIGGAAVGYMAALVRNGAEKAKTLSERDVLRSRTEELTRQIAETEQRAAADLSAVETRHQKQLEEMREQQKIQQEQQATLIREQIKTSAEEILKKRAEELTAANTEQLSVILTPLHENLKQMRDAVEKSDRARTESLTRLDQSIKENLKRAQEVGIQADKLAQALTSENKTQGDFGELRLKTLLENMGLEAGVQFEEQTAMRDDDGRLVSDENNHRLIPDVILHFPDDRDIIIDSKISLKAFTDYHEAENETDKAEALQRHLKSVKKHVDELAQKNYSSYIKNGKRKLDFVLMYIYSESALQLALANDPTLWKSAYEKGVIISGSQTLYMMLRILETTWRQMRQAENQDKIMTAANTLIDRVQIFYERFLKVDEQLKKTQSTFDDLKNSTADKGQSIVTSARQLLKYGAKENQKRKSLPLTLNGEPALPPPDESD